MRPQHCAIARRVSGLLIDAQLSTIACLQVLGYTAGVVGAAYRYKDCEAAVWGIVEPRLRAAFTAGYEAACEGWRRSEGGDP